MQGQRVAFLAFTSVLLAACGTSEKVREKEPIEIATGQHADEGPENRYQVPFEPITYGQKIKAPLPGLAYDYKMTDWNGDGLVDILANLRRGKGIVFYKNIGTKKKPLYRSLQENQEIMEAGDLGRYFDVIDLDGDGKQELIGYEGQRNQKELQSRSGKLLVFFNIGTKSRPVWDKKSAVDVKGDTLTSAPDVWNAPCLSIADWNNDGKQDIIIGYHHSDQVVPEGTPLQGSNRMSGFRDPDIYNVNTGKVAVLLNRTTEVGQPVFDRPRLLQSDGDTITTYVHPYPLVFDVDDDGLKDLVIGTHDTKIRVFYNKGSNAEPDLREGALFAGEKGQPLNTFLTIRLDDADLDGDGKSELIGSSYYGNQDRYLVYAREKQGWKNTGYLQIQATEETPVYGMGNTTIDPIDWDNDGDTDLLLGAEGSFPTIVENVGTEAKRMFNAAKRLKFTDGSPLETFSIEEGVGSYWGPMEWYSDRIAPRAVDWDGDGILDIISGSMGRRLYFFKGARIEGELRFDKPQNFKYNDSTLVLPDRLLPGVTDWNNDGHPDLILSNDPGHVLVYEGDRSLNLKSATRLDHSGGRPIVLHDFWDRDKGNRSGFTSADWDADGHRDLIIYEFHRGIFLFRNNGDDTFGEEQSLVPLYSHLAGPSVMDWNHDGVLDLIIGGDERRMIEPSTPAHLVVFRGQDILIKPAGVEK